MSHAPIPTCTLSVYNSLWNTFSVKVRHHFQKHHVLHKHGTSWTYSQTGRDVRNRHSKLGLYDSTAILKRKPRSKRVVTVVFDVTLDKKCWSYCVRNVICFGTSIMCCCKETEVSLLWVLSANISTYICSSGKKGVSFFVGWNIINVPKQKHFDRDLFSSIVDISIYIMDVHTFSPNLSRPFPS